MFLKRVLDAKLGEWPLYRETEEPEPIYSSPVLDSAFLEQVRAELNSLKPEAWWSITFFRVARCINCLVYRFPMPRTRVLSLEGCLRCIEKDLRRYYDEVYEESSDGALCEFHLCAYAARTAGLCVFMRFKLKANPDSFWLVVGDKIIAKRSDTLYIVLEHETASHNEQGKK